MNLYETTFIINPQTDDATIDRRVKDVADVITNNQGKIIFADHMGTRRLAYEIDGLAQGYYASFIFDAPTSALPALQRYYKLNEAYIRHLTVRFEGDIEKLLASTEPVGESAPVTRTEPAQPRPETKPVVEAEVEADVEAEESSEETASDASAEEESTESESVESISEEDEQEL